MIFIRHQIAAEIFLKNETKNYTTQSCKSSSIVRDPSEPAEHITETETTTQILLSEIGGRAFSDCKVIWIPL